MRQLLESVEDLLRSQLPVLVSLRELFRSLADVYQKRLPLRLRFDLYGQCLSQVEDFRDRVVTPLLERRELRRPERVNLVGNSISAADVLPRSRVRVFAVNSLST